MLDAAFPEDSCLTVTGESSVGITPEFQDSFIRSQQKNSGVNRTLPAGDRRDTMERRYDKIRPKKNKGGNRATIKPPRL